MTESLSLQLQGASLLTNFDSSSARRRQNAEQRAVRLTWGGIEARPLGEYQMMEIESDAWGWQVTILLLGFFALTMVGCVLTSS